MKSSENSQECEEMLRQLIECFEKIESSKSNLIAKFPSWKLKRQQSINVLLKLANNVNALHKGVNIANVTGSSVGVLGGFCTLSGILLAPVTGGASLTLTVAGIGAGLSGAATNITADILENRKLKNVSKDAKQCLADDEVESREIFDLIKDIMEASEKLTDLATEVQSMKFFLQNDGFKEISLDGKKLDPSISPAMGLRTIIKCLKASKVPHALETARALKFLMSQDSSDAVAGLTKAERTMVKSVKAIEGVGLATGAGLLSKVMAELAGPLAVVGIALDIVNIVSTSKNLAAGSLTSTENCLRQAASELRDQEKSLTNLVNLLEGDQELLNDK